jgi:cell division protein FtsB
MKIIAASLVALLLVLQYDLWVGEGSLTAAWQLEETIADQKQDNDRLKTRNDTLAAEVQDLKSGLAAIEERARSELGMIKEDETFVQVVEDKN